MRVFRYPGDEANPGIGDRQATGASNWGQDA